MAVGDIREVSGDSWGSGDTTGGDDGRGAGRECDTGLVGGLGRSDCDVQAEPGGDRVGVSDGTRVEHGVCDVHGAGSGEGDGVRCDGVEVRDIREVSGDAWGSGDTAGGDDGRGAGREGDTGLVGGSVGHREWVPRKKSIFEKKRKKTFFVVSLRVMKRKPKTSRTRRSYYVLKTSQAVED